MSGDTQASVPALRFPEFQGEWVGRKIGEFVIEMRGGAPLAPVDFVAVPGFEVIPKKAVTGMGKLQLADEGTYTTKEFFESHSASIVDQSFLITTLRDLVPSGPTIGYVVKIESLKKYLLAQGVYGLLLERDLLIDDFLVLISNRGSYRRHMQKIMVGSTQVHIRNRDFLGVNIFVPNAIEQKKIAEFLGAVDEKLTALRRKKELLADYKRGAMQKIFGQQIRFTRDDGSAFPDWEEKRLGEISTSNDSGIYKKAELYGEGHKIVGVSDLFSIRAVDGQDFRKVPLDKEEISKNTLRVGDILYAESSLVRKGIAKAVFVTERGVGTAFAWHTRRFSIDPSRANSAFVYYYLGSKYARKQIESVATQTALTGITTKDYFGTLVFLPTLVEQKRIAEFLSSLDAKIDTVAEQITQMESFKKGLLQQMFV